MSARVGVVQLPALLLVSQLPINALFTGSIARLNTGHMLTLLVHTLVDLQLSPLLRVLMYTPLFSDQSPDESRHTYNGTIPRRI